MKSNMWTKANQDRRSFIGGSDARIIMGDDESALLRLWQQKRGEVEPEDLSDNLIVQLGCSGGWSTLSNGGWQQPWTA